MTARAERLTDVGEYAAACATAFCRARCAGCDIKAIGATARAAAQLRADMESLHENAPAYGEDSDYLAELERVRRALLGRMTRCDLLAAEAQVRATVAVAAMAAAMARRPPDYAAYSAAQARHQDAVTAIDICNDVASRCDAARRLLAAADFGSVHEEPEVLVALGGQLPYEGRWFDGQPDDGRQDCDLEQVPGARP